MTRLRVTRDEHDEVELSIEDSQAGEVGRIIVDLERNDVNIRVEREDEALAGPVKVTCP